MQNGWHWQESFRNEESHCSLLSSSGFWWEQQWVKMKESCTDIQRVAHWTRQKAKDPGGHSEAVPTCSEPLRHAEHYARLLITSFPFIIPTEQGMWVLLFPNPCVVVAAQLYPTLCNPMDSTTPGLLVLHYLPEFAQIHVHWVNDAIQPSHPLLPPSPPALNLSQHHGLFQWVGSLHQVAKVLELQLQHQSFQWIFRADFL